MNYYLDVLKKYAVFDGRAPRIEFWMFVLFNVIVSIILSIADSIIGTDTGNTGLLGGLYSLGVLIPSIAVSVRRLHDIGRSGWWILIGLVPVVGWIVLIIWYVKDSDQGPNQYGPNPRGAALPA